MAQALRLEGAALRRVVALALALPVLSLFGAASARAAAPTIGSFDVEGTGTTFAECDDVEDQHAVTPPPAQGSGPFSKHLTFSPAGASASCADGSGTNTTSGNVTSSGAIDPTGKALSLSQSGTGTTTANANYTGTPPNGCVDVGAGTSSSTTVDFTITAPMPYSFAGTISHTSHGNDFYSLMKTNSPSALIFDQSQGLAPKLKGTLQPGTYEYKARAFAGNDIACNTSGSQTDSFTYRLKLVVGTLDTTPPNCTMAAKRNQKIIRRVRHGHKHRLKRTPFGAAVLQDEDGQVSAAAAGRTRAGDPISLTPASSGATAGNGVAMKLPLGRQSEKRILAAVRKGQVPKMLLTGTCEDSSGNTSHVSAVIRFRDKKPGKRFKFPLIAEATPH
jgi:hypothetical protein